MTEKFIDHPIINTLEDHTDQLKEIQRVVSSLHRKYDKEKKIIRNLTEKTIEDMEHVTYKCLYKVGELSMSVGVVKDTLKDHYDKTYSHSPAIGKKLFNKHYFGLFKPYDTIKENIWELISILEKEKDKDKNSIK